MHATATWYNSYSLTGFVVIVRSLSPPFIHQDTHIQYNLNVSGTCYRSRQL